MIQTPSKAGKTRWPHRPHSPYAYSMFSVGKKHFEQKVTKGTKKAQGSLRFHAGFTRRVLGVEAFGVFDECRNDGLCR